MQGDLLGKIYIAFKCLDPIDLPLCRSIVRVESGEGESFLAIIGVIFIESVKGGCILDAIACRWRNAKRVGTESVALIESKTV